MSNTVANQFYVYGPQDRVDVFLGAFLRDGMQAHVPIPPDAEPLEDPALNHRSRSQQISVEYWGAYNIGPEIYWTCGGAYGVSMLTKGIDRLFRPQVLQLDHVRGVILNEQPGPNNGRAYPRYFRRPTRWEGWSDLPGCVPPSKEDAIAYCKFYSPWCAPFLWFGAVATDLYPSGLRFVMNSTDLTAVGNDGSHEIFEYWSVDSPGEFYQDGHWAASVQTVDPSDDDDEYLYHEDESCEMVRQAELEHERLETVDGTRNPKKDQ